MGSADNGFNGAIRYDLKELVGVCLYLRRSCRNWTPGLSGEQSLLRRHSLLQP